MFSAYADVCRYLASLGVFHMDLTLNRMDAALENLGLTHVPFPVVQIVGTNGKGSTAAFLASLAQAHGLRVGLYTSPHFVRVAERIRINGVPLSPQCWPELANAVMDAAPELTYFEVLTVLALLAFVRHGVDVAVMEAGLGGRMDATTACPAEMLCVTPIDLDHEGVLGWGVAAIAADKAAAMRVGERVYSAAQPPAAALVLQAEAVAKGAHVCFAPEVCPLPPADALGLLGPHQRDNAQLALCAWRELAQTHGWASDPARAAQGLRQTFMPGRLQRCPAQHGLPPLLLDGAHNPHGMRALRDALAAVQLTPSAVIFSCMADKDVDHILPALRDLAHDCPVYTVTVADNARTAQAADLAARIGPPAEAVETLPAALARCAACPDAAVTRPVLICGSLYLLGEFFTLYPEYLLPASVERTHA